MEVVDRDLRPTERAAAALRRVVDIGRRVIGGLRVLAGLAAGLVTAAWAVWVVDAAPADSSEWLARVVVLVVLLIPSAVLLVFVAGLCELARLPERFRELPSDVRTQTVRARTPRGVRGLLASLFRLAMLAWGSREILSPYAAISVALRPAILLGALAATAAAIVEIPASVLAMLVMALA